MSEKVAIKCPVCNSILTCSVNDVVKSVIVCSKCKTPLQLHVVPQNSLQNALIISQITILNNINRLYEVLIRKLEKMLG